MLDKARKNQDEEEVDCGGSCPSICPEKQEPRNVTPINDDDEGSGATFTIILFAIALVGAIGLGSTKFFGPGEDKRKKISLSLAKNKYFN